MSIQDDAFLQRLRSTFKIEAEEHLHVLSSYLLELEKNPPIAKRDELIEAAFRHAHSLKGAARAVNLTTIESICQSFESFFSAWKRHESSPSPRHFDALHRAIDLISTGLPAADGTLGVIDRTQVEALTRQLDELGGGREIQTGHGQPTRESLPSSSVEERASSASPEIARFASDVRGDVPDAASPTTPSVAFEGPAVAQTVRISTAKLDQLLLEAEEMLTVKLGTARRAADLQGLQAVFDRWATEWNRVQPHVLELHNAARRVSSGNGPVASAPNGVVEPLVNSGPPLVPTGAHLPEVLEFLDWNLTHLKLLESKVQAISMIAAKDRLAVGRRVDDLLSEAKQLVMLPFSTLLDLIPRLVRDLSREQGKDVALVTRGGDVEVDKRILEQMKDPLIHLVRNSIDHGIETPHVRAHHNKPPRATLTISVAQVDGNRVEILVSDDGAGINLERVKEVAVKLGTLSSADAAQLSEQQALALVFQSEVSTSPVITEISGRGLGLAIVREATEKLGGQALVETRPHIGTTFRLNLPSLLAVFRGILVRSADQRFVIPSAHVERVARVQSADIQTVENRETVSLGGRTISLARLEDLLELPRTPTHSGEAPFVFVVVLATADERVALAVDEVLHEEEVLVKSFSRPLSRVRNIAGATILEAGKVVPVLNVLDLIKSARRPGFQPSAPLREGLKSATKRKRILVAEDSITSRMLLKNILEAADYEVQTVVDGMEALTELRMNEYDLVVSDVEMPRMNGFDLTTHIRSDRKLAEKPVILVTALSSREDRERGIDVGANAYIVKSSFDQSNLLEAVRRFA